MKRNMMIGLMVAFAVILGISNTASRYGTTEKADFSVETTENGEIRHQRELAEAYNGRLAGKEIPSVEKKDILDSYLSILNRGGGVMGWLCLPNETGWIPIYHGIGDGAERNAVGHLPSSALPMGGEGNHSILVCFAKVQAQIVPGDTFQIRILDQILTYQAESICPGIDETWKEYCEGDLCTLVIPNGDAPIGIRGVRIQENIPEANIHVLAAVVCVLLGMLVWIIWSLMVKSIRRSK